MLHFCFSCAIVLLVNITIFSWKNPWIMMKIINALEERIPMALAVCFRYKEREYYKELQTGDEVCFGK